MSSSPFLLCMFTSPSVGEWSHFSICAAEEKNRYFVTNTIYVLISFMQTSEDERKNIYK